MRIARVQTVEFRSAEGTLAAVMDDDEVVKAYRNGEPTNTDDTELLNLLHGLSIGMSAGAVFDRELPQEQLRAHYRAAMK